MSVVDTVVRLTRQVASRTAHAIVHPVETATGVADLAGSAASAAAGTVTGRATDTEEDPGDTGATQPTASTSTTAAPPEALLFPPEPTPAAPPVATEPKPADVDDWRDELDDEDDADEVPQPVQDDDRPLLDPSVAKAVRHESERMRRAAERDPEKAIEAH